MTTLNDVIVSLKQNPDFLPLIADLLACLDPDPTGGLGPLEERILTASRALSTYTLAKGMEAWDPKVPDLVFQGQRYRRRSSPTPATYHGLDGPVHLERFTYRPVHGGPCICPLEMHAGLVLGKYTPKAAEFLLMQACCHEYRQAVELQKLGHLLGISKSAMHHDLEQIGTPLPQELESMDHALRAKLWVPPEAQSLSVSLDRTGIPMEEPLPKPRGRRKKGAPKTPCEVVHRQVYCAVVTLHDPQGEALESWRLAAMPGEGEQVVERARKLVERLLEVAPKLEVMWVCDGAAEMQRKCAQICQGVEVQAEVVDYWHACEYITKASAAVGRSEEAGRLRQKLWKNQRGAAQVLTEMGSWWFEQEHEVKELEAAMSYFRNHKKRMKYAQVRARGWPVGSGHVEATCKSVVAARFKKSGARWKEPGASPLLHLRAYLKSAPGAWQAVMPVLLDSFVHPIQAAA